GVVTVDPASFSIGLFTRDPFRIASTAFRRGPRRPPGPAEDRRILACKSQAGIPVPADYLRRPRSRPFGRGPLIVRHGAESRVPRRLNLTRGPEWRRRL